MTYIFSDSASPITNRSKFTYERPVNGSSSHGKEECDFFFKETELEMKWPHRRKGYCIFKA